MADVAHHTDHGDPRVGSAGRARIHAQPLPSGDPPGQPVPPAISSTTPPPATGPSASVKTRPLTSRTPAVSKKPGLTER